MRGCPSGSRGRGLVVVVTAGNYNQPENWRLPVAILNQFVLPALVGSTL